ncbi:uncharacterized protein LOC142631242 isoform X1 [Castanea sativa]|uniref:uncharacterized protein LOC142631242 isoform X1 n=1 Tax=Castanea sativa TaxID=21020 RepID=UPI003F64FA24
MVDVNFMGISKMNKAAFITMKNWRDCGSCPSMLVSVYLWASWFDRGVALRGFLPLTSKSLILPPDIDTLDLVESKEFSLKLISLMAMHSKFTLLKMSLQCSRHQVSG